MKICVAGWYFRPSFLNMIVTSGYEAFVVKHREGDTCGIPSKLHENIGLEFGAYRQYVENHWDGESDVLFLHDDAEVSESVAFEDVSLLNPMGVDQAYIFHDENEEYINGGAHGRGIWMRGNLLKRIAADFPADLTNYGTNIGVVAQKGIIAFYQKMRRLSPNTNVIAIVPQFRFAHRGRLHERLFAYRKIWPIPGGLVNVHE